MATKNKVFALNGAPKTDRRTFLAGTAAAGASVLLAPQSVLGGADHAAPSERLNIAAIGFGGMGSSNIKQCASENFIALCDVDQDYAAPVFNALPDARRYTDYGEMLDAEPDIDGVIIATPDHTHAVIAAAVMRAGKHVYCQKPLTHDVREARALADLARETGVITQMGIQGHSGEGARQIYEWIRAGVIGEVREVDAWCSLSYYPWGHASWSSPVNARPEEMPPVPDTLNWDLWLGPAKERPYHPCYHPRSWRSWWDFGCGMMGDRGAHTFDPIVWALDLGHPTSIEGSSTGTTEELHPLSSIMRYEFPARNSMPPVTLTWYEGLQPPRPTSLDNDEPLGDPEGGVLFKGTEGMLTCGVYGQNARLLPESRMRTFVPPAQVLPRVEGSHEQDWLNAIRSGKPAGADFAYSGPLTEIVLLGNVAKRLNTRIVWDGDTMRVTNHAEADAYLRPAYRKGWSL